ncbi:hypothetical protein ACM41_07735 [Bradyrhizobium sp. CCBAU 21362]|uniref:hypothetical protein n=1 Tax=Bradyrhizobium sp. CCBAU 21362 TaxID=1325082 RepID=UPI0023060C62|nr:hypothetical protein [Bradyrhizobium sp. CCBAU 21362]MDA9536161.1 hypothetical protein [Bradyrhizobium sp. CCBAU 21362]
MGRLKRRTELYLPVAERVVREGFGAPTLADIEALARAKTEAALNVLAAIMLRETANAFARVAAANAILDRGWGKPVQPLATDKAPLELLHRIERVIVHPDHSSPIADEMGEAELQEASQSILPPEKKLQ